MGLTVVAAAVAACMVAPLAYLAVRAWGVHDGLGELLAPRVSRLAWATVLLAGTVTALATVLGGAVAFLLERTDVPGRRLLGVAAVLPLVVPTYVGALALVAALGPRGLAWDVPGVVGFWGLAAALTLSTYPYVLLTARAVLRAADPALEEVARALGDGQWTAVGRVLLPQLRPALTAGGLLVFLYVLSDFGAVSIMRFDTLTRGIFLEYRASFDRARPALLGLVLVAMTLLAIAAERRLRGRPAPSRVVAGAAPPSLLPLGRWRAPASVAVASLAFAGVGVPVAVLAYWSTVGTSGLAGASLTRAGMTSLALSVAAATVAVAAALPVAVLAVRHRSRLSRMLETFSLSGYALPGLVIALALVFFTARFLPALYQTLPLLVVAYVVRFLPEALGSVRSSLHQVDPALEDAARLLGRREPSVFLHVTIPLAWRGLAAGALLAFARALGDFGATLMVAGNIPGLTQTASLAIYDAVEAGQPRRALGLSLLVSAIAIAVLVVVQAALPGRRLGR